jgi:hypothetical protein
VKSNRQPLRKSNSPPLNYRRKQRSTSGRTFARRSFSLWPTTTRSRGLSLSPAASLSRLAFSLSLSLSLIHSCVFFSLHKSWFIKSVWQNHLLLPRQPQNFNSSIFQLENLFMLLTFQFPEQTDPILSAEIELIGVGKEWVQKLVVCNFNIN